MSLKFDGYNTGLMQKADKSWKITIETQELRPETVADLARFSGQYCKMMISDENISNEMVKIFEDMEVMQEAGSKTPSKRLRDNLFVLWKTSKDNGLIDSEFETFYRGKIESWIIKIQELVNSMVNG